MRKTWNLIAVGLAAVAFVIGPTVAGALASPKATVAPSVPAWSLDVSCHGVRASAANFPGEVTLKAATTNNKVTVTGSGDATLSDDTSVTHSSVLGEIEFNGAIVLRRQVACQ